MADGHKPVRRAMPPRTRSNFITRTAIDATSQLDGPSPTMPPAQMKVPEGKPPERKPPQDRSEASGNSYGPQSIASKPTPRHQPPTGNALGMDGNSHPPLVGRRSSSRRRKNSQMLVGDSSLTAQMHAAADAKYKEDQSAGPRVGAMPRPVGGQAKLGTFSGVFVPTSLNVLSILMFLRFGFILGQSGVLGMMGMLIASYIINLVTTLSISAIATNGTVRGGGAYYLISRSLGPEFGGSIGVVFYLGSLFNTSLNSVGLIDCLKQNFGSESGDWAQWLPEGYWWEYLWATVVLIICTGICLAGSGIFARCSNGLLAILLAATFSIPFSSFIIGPFKKPRTGLEYTGLSAQTFKENLLPKFTQGAAGSQLPGKENFQDLFGILFPATGGIFAGASMSGDLKHPSKAIPKGTLAGLVLTFFAYAVVILAMAATITRASLYKDVNIIQETNISGVLVLLGEFATSFFSSLMGVIGSAKLFQALARDNLLPGFSIFGQGTKGNDEPTYAIIVTYVIAQIAMLSNINQLASFVTMTYLMTFLVTNLACFLLKISSAPNFRPSFHYFNWWTAGFGTLISGASMFFVDGVYATGSICILIVIFLIIHYTSPPKSWGDVSQSLIYHQVRKYLLRLRQEHVKFWRPQILLFINDPRKQYKLIQFCNSLKKGALFVLGHVIISDDFGAAVPEARRQQAAWTKYIDFSKIKAFVNVAIAPQIQWGTRNIVLSAGLGGMRPNIVVMGFYNLDEFRRSQPLVDVPSPQQSKAGSKTASIQKSRRKGYRRTASDKLRGTLPTDICRTEGGYNPTNYVTILEDLLLSLQINVAVAKGFENLEFPHPKEENTKKYIDLWPIQMSAEIAGGGEEKQNVLTTNFDTYTLILQLGCILHTVDAWKKVYKVRCAVFVEWESEVEDERARVKTLLDNLRIEAEVLVFWLASGDVKSYQIIVNGNSATADPSAEQAVDEVLREEEWWQEVQKVRGKRGEVSAREALADVQGLLDVSPSWPNTSFRSNRQEANMERFEGLKKMLRQSEKRRHPSKNLGNLGVRLGMTTHRLSDQVVLHHASHASASEGSSTGDSDGDTFDSDSADESSSRASAASENDAKSTASRWKADSGDGEGDEFEVLVTKPPIKAARRRSDGGSVKDLPPRKHGSSKFLQEPIKVPRLKISTASSVASSLDQKTTPEITRPSTSSRDPQPSSSTNNSLRSAASRPRPMRRSSAGKFSSRPVPNTTVATEDGPGPSIMFTDSDTPTQVSSPYPSSNNGRSHEPATPASGFPSPQSIPLSFNDLPCRAQHLILNELMQQHSDETAVVFTTLPSPVEGTCLKEEDSVSYLSDLEVLCQGLPPVLLVHSNSMTVTMNL